MNEGNKRQKQERKKNAISSKLILDTDMSLRKYIDIFAEKA